MEYKRLTKESLWTILEAWDPYMPKKMRLIACGGTAMTLQDLKPSTKDVDFIVPEVDEYDALVKTLQKIGYKRETGTGWGRGDGYLFDLFRGHAVYTTELLESPLENGNNTHIRSFKKIYVGVLNDYDLITTKMFRGTDVDIEDCLALIKKRGAVFDLERLKTRYKEMASYDVSEQRVLGNLQGLLNQL